jgi:hypothetical protein
LTGRSVDAERAPVLKLAFRPISPFALTIRVNASKTSFFGVYSNRRRIRLSNDSRDGSFETPIINKSETSKVFSKGATAFLLPQMEKSNDALLFLEDSE